MAVDIDTVAGLFQTLLEGVEDVNQAHKYTPRSLVEANCPQCLIHPGEALHDVPKSDWFHIVREWTLTLITSKATVMPYGNQEKELYPLIEDVEDAFGADLKIGSSDNDFIAAYITGDTGSVMIEFPPESGEMWHGCQWTANVETKRVF